MNDAKLPLGALLVVILLITSDCSKSYTVVQPSTVPAKQMIVDYAPPPPEVVIVPQVIPAIPLVLPPVQTPPAPKVKLQVTVQSPAPPCQHVHKKKGKCLG